MVCPSLQSPAHGRLQISGHSYHDIAALVCDAGFSIDNGSGVRVCQSNGQWDGTNAVCVGKEFICLYIIMYLHALLVILSKLTYTIGIA